MKRLTIRLEWTWDARSCLQSYIIGPTPLSPGVSYMRTFAICCTLLLLLGCDTLGGRTVILDLSPKGSRSPDNATVEQALLIVDQTMAREGISRASASSGHDGRTADYVGGHFICGAGVQDGKFIVDFRNPHFGGGRPDAEVVRVSDAVANDLRSHYGAKQVRIKN